MRKNNLKKLKHISAKIKGGGEVILLDTGATIDAEAEAMLQALHSRSTGGLKHHLKILEKRGPEDFMANFYVGYGHKSIGDCGSVTLFIEGVSMLAAKAIQDWPLYSGQESSTRYLDFAKQKFIDPTENKEFVDPIRNAASKYIFESWRHFYKDALPILKEDLKKRYPKLKDEDDKVYEKAISARAFDILRAFLPAGTSTNLAWHSNLRQIADKLLYLRHHPLEEVRNIAQAIEKVLKERYPSSFSHKKYEETEKYAEFAMQNYYYHNKSCPSFKMTKNSLDKKMLEDKAVQMLLKKRPNAKTELPKYLSLLGNVDFEFQLDFGSFRDLQRHRSLKQRMPLLTLDLGFESWYLNELPKELKEKAEKFIKEQEKVIKSLSKDKHLRQYYIAMGYKIANKISGDLPALVYTAELRSTRFAHPTVRKVAFKIINYLEKNLAKYGLKLYPDKDPNRFDTKRGLQDIVLKK